jgi:hypothetical protein
MFKLFRQSGVVSSCPLVGNAQGATQSRSGRTPSGTLRRRKPLAANNE